MDSQTWAKKCWENASKDWEFRKQDRNYRRYLTNPQLNKELRGLSVKRGTHIDIGCGEGSETNSLRNLLKKRGFTNFLGFDTNKKFIDLASRKYEGINFFHNKDINNFVRDNSLENKADLVTSLFVLQDAPQIWYLVEEQARMLKERGVSLNLIVNPQFAEALNEKGLLKIPLDVHRKRYDNYLFAAEYPIVEEGKKPFCVPYFHRNLSDYIQLFEKYFYIDSVESLKPSEQLLEKSLRDRISPFYPENNNVYWPEISKIPSSVIIKGVKK